MMYLCSILTLTLSFMLVVEKEEMKWQRYVFLWLLGFVTWWEFMLKKMNSGAYGFPSTDNDIA